MVHQMKHVDLMVYHVLIFILPMIVMKTSTSSPETTISSPTTTTSSTTDDDDADGSIDDDDDDDDDDGDDDDEDDDVVAAAKAIFGQTEYAEYVYGENENKVEEITVSLSEETLRNVWLMVISF